MVFLGDAKGNESFLTKFYVIPITMKLENPWCVMLLRRAEHAVAPTSSQECAGSQSFAQTFRQLGEVASVAPAG